MHSNNTANMEGAAAEITTGGDPRLDFMGIYVQRRLKLKPEKWARLTSTEEHKNTLKEFLDGDQQMQLIVVLTLSAQLLPLINFPLTQLKTKGNSLQQYYRTIYIIIY